MFVVPAKSGLQVPDPVLKDHLPPEGRDVNENDPYWVRRINDGDVVVKPPMRKSSVVTPASSKKTETSKAPEIKPGTGSDSL